MAFLDWAIGDILDFGASLECYCLPEISYSFVQFETQNIALTGEELNLRLMPDCAAHPNCPTFSNYPVRVWLKKRNSGEMIRDYGTFYTDSRGVMVTTQEITNIEYEGYQSAVLEGDTLQVVFNIGSSSNERYVREITVVPFRFDIVSSLPEEKELSAQTKEPIDLSISMSAVADEINLYEDGVLLESIPNTDIANFVYSGVNQGIHEVKIEAFLEGVARTATWIITVSSPLEFDVISPDVQEITIPFGEPYIFSASTNEIPSTFNWILNYNLVLQDENVTDSSLELIPSLEGNNILKLETTGENKTISYEWAITVIPSLAFEKIYPEFEEFEISIGNEAVFYVSTNNIYPLIQWYLNDELVKEESKSDSLFSFSPEFEGLYKISVDVSAGGKVESQTWTMSVSTEISEPSEEMNILPLLGAAGIGLLLISGRKKKK